jgi:hypothetical protein
MAVHWEGHTKSKPSRKLKENHYYYKSRHNIVPVQRAKFNTKFIWLSFLLEQISLNDVHHNLVCALKDLMDSKISQKSFNRVVL